jgi:transmembrane sensor
MRGKTNGGAGATRDQDDPARMIMLREAGGSCLRAYLWRTVRNAPAVADILEEAAIRYYAAPKHSIRHPGPWFRQMAMRCAVDPVRDPARSPRVNIPDAAEHATGTASTPDTALNPIELDPAVITALQSLPENQSELLQLRFVGNQPLDELAQRCNTTPIGIQQPILRALCRCRTALLEVGILTGALSHPTDTADDAWGAQDTQAAAFRSAAIAAERSLSDEEHNALTAGLHNAAAPDTLATAMNCGFQLRHAPAHNQHSIAGAPRRRRCWNQPIGRWVALAASLLILATYALWYTDLLNRGRVYQTETAERLTAVLDDGTSVVLNTASAIRWLGKGCDRRVALLRGEVLFDVHPDLHCPFTVLLKTGVSISVLGARFDTYWHNTGQIEVTVLAGSVQVNGAQWSQVLTPDQSASVADRKLSVTEHANTEQPTAWLKDQVTFDNVPLAEAIQELQRYTKLPIEIADAELTTLRITGVFSTADIRTTLARLVSRPSGGVQHPGIWLERLSNGTLVLHAVSHSDPDSGSHP